MVRVRDALGWTLFGLALRDAVRMVFGYLQRRHDPQPAPPAPKPAGHPTHRFFPDGRKL